MHIAEAIDQVYIFNAALRTSNDDDEVSELEALVMMSRSLCWEDKMNPAA